MNPKGRMPGLACGPFLLAVLIAGCAERTRPSDSENEKLDNAAEMLNSAPATLNSIDRNALGPATDNAPGNETVNGAEPPPFY